MSNQVFANGRELACKAGSGKTICAMPDVCMTPPENPATPPGVPVPYPNTGLASDTSDGSTTVSRSEASGVTRRRKNAGPVLFLRALPADGPADGPVGGA